MKNIIWKSPTVLVLSLILTSCATEKAQYGKNAQNFIKNKNSDIKSIEHTFYLIGDAGNADKDEAVEILKQFKTRLDSASANSTLLFLGDNIYPYGMPLPDSKYRKEAELKIDKQLELTENFKGQTVFIPGNHDWYSKGTIGPKEEQNYIVNKTGNKNAFLPKNQCAIETKKIGKDIAVIYVDSEWYLTNWDQIPGINENCDIKTREDFFSELEDQLNKNQNKTIVLAIHHPLIDHGSHGGIFSWKKQLYPIESTIPLPGLASVFNIIRSAGGFSHQDLNHPNYRKLSNRIQTLIADRNNVIVVSGHDHNLQYIEKNNIHQIISGAGSKNEAAAALQKNDFSYGKNGYAQLDIFKDGSANIQYYGKENNEEKLLFQKNILENSNYKPIISNTQFNPTTSSSIYTSKETKKSSFYELFWGKTYRQNYAIPIEAPTLIIDTLYGGAKPTRMGGGHQTNSLRLETEKGEYVLRALRKSGSRFLQAVAFKDQYVVDDVSGSFADQFLLDFYTSSHPYTSLAIAQLSDAVNIPHTHPKLVYVPKQKGLNKYNENFGDEIYFLEERPSETEENPNKVLGAEEVLKLLQKDEKYRMNEQAYIRARLFDMLIGDWDRHQDQWKFTQKGKEDYIYFSPIPKDRDQAFARYDGWLTKLIMTIPDLRHMQSFTADIRNIKWFNREPYPLDLALIRNANIEDWITEARYLQQNITEEIIDKSFKLLPKEVQNKDLDIIKRNLLERKEKLQDFALEYHNILQRIVPITGTQKKDRFVIHRKNDNNTEIKIYRNKKDGEELTFEKTYSNNKTKEIWLYGLGDSDEFIINGNSKKPIQLRLLGGWNNDTYTINSKKKIGVYDYKTKKNTFNGNSNYITLSDDYNLNEYNYKKPYYNVFGLMPNLGFNPDDGLTLGTIAHYTFNGFKRNPFTSKHSLKTNYLTKSGGYEIGYTGIFPKITGNWFYQIDADYSSSKFIRNFYGLGNESINDKKYENEFYRVRAKNMRFAPSFNWEKNASKFSAKLVYENIKVEKTPNRYITQNSEILDEVFETQHFAGTDITFYYNNQNKNVSPTLGLRFDTRFTYLQNLNDHQNKVPTLETGLGITHYLTTQEKIIFSTYAKAKWVLSNQYHFYQMTTLGGNEDLRGFRFDRFYGKNSFYQTSNLKWNIGTYNNSFIPVKIALFGGFDYGRVWLPNDHSNQWHTSYGGGLILNILDQIGLQGSYFRSKDGGRFIAGFGINF